jgi:hypothetical protein
MFVTFSIFDVNFKIKNMAKKLIELPDELMESIKIEAIKAKIPANKLIVDVLSSHLKMKENLKMEVSEQGEVYVADKNTDAF